jgi:hypothetical protein
LHAAGTIEKAAPMPTFMLIDGFNGGSTDPAHLGWFEVEATSLAAALGGAGGQPLFNDISVALGGLAPALLAKLTGEGDIGSIRIQQVDNDGAAVFDLLLGGVRVTQHDVTAVRGEATQTSLSFAYELFGLTTPSSSFAYDTFEGAEIGLADIPQPRLSGLDALESAGVTRYYLVINQSAQLVGGRSSSWFEIDSLQFGVGVEGTGGLFSRPSFSDLTVSLSGVSAALLGEMTRSGSLSSVHIQGVDGNNVLVQDLRLADVNVSSQQVVAAGGVPSTRFTLAYESLGLISGGFQSGYDLAARQVLDAANLPALTRSATSDYVDSSAVTQYFMAIDGLNGGESNGDSSGWFEIDTVRLDAERAVKSGLGGPPDFERVVVGLEGLSPALLAELAAADGLGAVRVQGLDENGHVVYDLRLGEVVLTAATSDAAAGDVPVSTLFFGFGQIGLTAGGRSFGYDATTAGVIPATSIPAAAPALDGPDALQSEVVSHHYLLIAPSGGGTQAAVWVEIDSMQLGGELDLNGNSGSFSEVDLRFAGVAPQLLGAFASGTRLEAVQVQGVNSAGELVYDLRLGDVFVSAVDTSADSEVPVSGLSMTFDRIGLIAGDSHFGYDRSDGAAFDPTTLPYLTRVGQDSAETGAVSRYFIRIDGFNGSDSFGSSRGWFKVESLQLDAGVAGVAADGGAVGKSEFDSLNVSLAGLSPALLEELARAENFGIRAVQVLGVAADNTVVYDLRLGDVFLSRTSLQSGGDTLVTDLSFDFLRIGLTTATAGSFGYDLSTLQAIPAGSMALPGSFSGADVFESRPVAQYLLFINDPNLVGPAGLQAGFVIDSLRLDTSAAPAAKSGVRGDVQFGEVTVSFSGVAADLLDRLANGTEFASVQIRGLDSNGLLIQDLRLGEVTITSHAISSVDSPSGTLSFSYERIGLITDGAGSFGYNVIFKTATNPTAIPAVVFTGSAPLVTALASSVGEDGPAFTQNLLAGASDPDPGSILVIEDLAPTVTTAGGRTLTLGTDYTLSGATLALTTAGFGRFDSLGAGQTDQAVVGFRVSDGVLSTANVLTLTINGANDAAVLGSAAVRVNETNAPIVTGGTLSLFDVDGPAAYIAQPATAGRHGVFTLGADGQWTYRANLAYDYLNPASH